MVAHLPPTQGRNELAAVGSLAHSVHGLALVQSCRVSNW
jgi:hypothetical protein